MTQQNQNKPTKLNSIMDALGTRGADAPPQTVEEITRQAVADANAERVAKVDTEQPTREKSTLRTSPQKTALTRPNESDKNVQAEIASVEESSGIMETTHPIPFPITAKAEILVSNIDPQPATETCTPDLAGQTQQVMDEPNLRRLKDFVASNVYSPKWVMQHLVQMSNNPKVMPAVTIWGIPGGFDKAELVYNLVIAAGYVDGVWPYLSMIMGKSSGNLEWTASVLTTIALFDAIKMLPFVLGEK